MEPKNYSYEDLLRLSNKVGIILDLLPTTTMVRIKRIKATIEEKERLKKEYIFESEVKELYTNLNEVVKVLSVNGSLLNSFNKVLDEVCLRLSDFTKAERAAITNKGNFGGQVSVIGDKAKIVNASLEELKEFMDTISSSGIMKNRMSYLKDHLNNLHNSLVEYCNSYRFFALTFFRSIVYYALLGCIFGMKNNSKILREQHAAIDGLINSIDKEQGVVPIRDLEEEIKDIKKTLDSDRKIEDIEKTLKEDTSFVSPPRSPMRLW